MSEPPGEHDYPGEPYDRLLYYAAADLQAAEAVLRLSNPFWHEPCFLARECAEKALKAFIEAAGRAAPEVHGLRTLCRECAEVDKGFLRFARHAQVLGPHQSAARYPPLGDYPYSREVANEAVRLAREVFDFVDAKIEQRKARGLL